MRCAECGEKADRMARGWRAYRVEGPNGETELVFYCPGCAEREFDEWNWREQRV